MDDDDRDLGFYSPQDGYFIYVMDLNPNSLTKELEDLSQVEKYIMSEEDYDKLPSFFYCNMLLFKKKIVSFRKFKKDFIKSKAKPQFKEKNNEFMKEEAEKFMVFY